MKSRYAFLWFWVQLGIVLLFGWTGFSLGAGLESDAPWFAPALFFLIAVLSTPWQLAWARRHDPTAGDDLFAPSWFRRPFDGPLQTVFLGSRAFIALGTCGLLSAVFFRGDFLGASLALAFGLGLYIGMWWYLRSALPSQHVGKT